MIYILVKKEMVNTGADDHVESQQVATERSLAAIVSHVPGTAKLLESHKDLDPNEPYFHLFESVEWNRQRQKTVCFYQ